MINSPLFIKDVTSNKNELNKLLKQVKAIPTKGLTKDLIEKFSILIGAKYFSSGILQNYLLFIPANNYIKYFSDITPIESWKSNTMSAEVIENITISDSKFVPTFVDHHLLPDMNFDGHCLIKSNFSIPKRVINVIFYTLLLKLKNLNTDFALGNCLFGSLKLTKDPDPGKYKYTGNVVRFNSRSGFLFRDGSCGKNVIIFGADMSSSVHVDNNKKYILIFSEGPTQGLDDTTLTA